MSAGMFGNIKFLPKFLFVRFVMLQTFVMVLPINIKASTLTLAHAGVQLCLLKESLPVDIAGATKLRQFNALRLRGGSVLSFEHTPVINESLSIKVVHQSKVAHRANSTSKKKTDNSGKSKAGQILEGITVSKSVDFAAWYAELVVKSEMIEYYDIRQVF